MLADIHWCLPHLFTPFYFLFCHRPAVSLDNTLSLVLLPVPLVIREEGAII